MEESSRKRKEGARGEMSALRIAFPGNTACLGEARRAVAAVTRRFSVSKDDEADILLAFGEACSNAIRHGKLARDGRLDVTCRLLDSATAKRQIEIEIRNPGNGFHIEQWEVQSMPPAELYLDHGRGIPLMQMLMDSVEVFADQGNTVVRMTKSIN